MSDAPRGRDVLWRLLDDVGLEHCRLASEPRGHVLTGLVVTTEDGRPVTIEYRIGCDRFWHTREVCITLVDGRLFEATTLGRTSDGDGSWWQDDDGNLTAGPQIRGCIDVDLAFTPATNALPIRRHDMAVGGRVEVNAAWVQIPSLGLAVLNQRYTPTEPRRRWYEAPGQQFTALLEVDELGLMRTYEGVWERIAESDVAVPALEETSDA